MNAIETTRHALHTDDRGPILKVSDLETRFFKGRTVIRAVNGVGFELSRGEILGIVGESGCGKSVTALSILRLIPRSLGRITSGQVEFCGKDLATLPEREMRKVRGREIAMIFQEPMTSLNPVIRIGDQIAEVLRLHRGMGSRDAFAGAVRMLQTVGIPDPERGARSYPHHYSGGMRQRAMIAMALAAEPQLLIADEPTTALDVTVQAQILQLIRELNEQSGTAIMLITHDLGVIAETAHRVIVMYAGQAVEEATVGDLFARPLHPYTRGLMRALPRRGAANAANGRRGRLHEIEGMVPSLREDIVGCPFAPRCEFVTETCRRERPPMRNFDKGHFSACFEVERLPEWSARA